MVVVVASAAAAIDATDPRAPAPRAPLAAPGEAEQADLPEGLPDDLPEPNLPVDPPMDPPPTDLPEASDAGPVFDAAEEKSAPAFDAARGLPVDYGAKAADLAQGALLDARSKVAPRPAQPAPPGSGSGEDQSEESFEIAGAAKASTHPHVAPPPRTDEDGIAGALAAVGFAGVASIAAGALAYFWPTLKYALTPIAPLYTRIPRDAVLAHETREHIYRLVRENPGIHAQEVAQRLDLGWGTAVHHLKLLEDHGLLQSHRDGRYKRFFLVGDERLAYRDAVALLRNSTCLRIALQVGERPGLIQKDVCEALGVSSSLATFHLKRLAEAGIVLAHRRGRVVQYEPGPAWSALRDLDAAAGANASA
jgi:DNA-binding transcriptional ArsR family regulator